MVLPPTDSSLGDPLARPYFLWWTDPRMLVPLSADELRVYRDELAGRFRGLVVGG